ncbi:hypothetical protein FOB82_02400 [Corynebacterium xerosis]|uniref:Uncharacterized protein n=1 Tax=Corynebacterium xerosis TaxID=1725 RepID=A0A6B8TLZ2_9CORY|nr:hypothetical protein [Corynebacterium xerosis]QGS33966.1 hypothetical protein FOB82_02400 [Corynebacterium xerosis]
MKTSIELTRVSGEGTFAAKLTRDRKRPGMFFFAAHGFVACLSQDQAIAMANHLADLLEDA